jgi:hypothetical protein
LPAVDEIGALGHCHHEAPDRAVHKALPEASGPTVARKRKVELEAELAGVITLASVLHLGEMVLTESAGSGISVESAILMVDPGRLAGASNCGAPYARRIDTSSEIEAIGAIAQGDDARTRQEISGTDCWVLQLMAMASSA